MSEEPSAPAREEKERIQRISFQGMAATTSTLAALIVALASAFTAIRAFTLTETAAQQRVFERQLDACLELNTLASHVAANNSMLEGVLTLAPEQTVVNRPVPGGPAPTVTEHTAALEADVRMNTLEVLQQQLDREVMRLNMILPGPETSEKLRSAYNRQNDLLTGLLTDDGSGASSLVLPAPAPTIQRASALVQQIDTDMNDATGLCQGYVSEVVRRGTLG